MPDGGQRGVADVVVEVEVRVVDPHRAAEPPRHEAHLLAVAGNARELAGDQRQDLVVRGARSFEDGARADVHVGDAVLGVEERAVECAHVVHAARASQSLLRSARAERHLIHATG